jgi:hypothetical protein
VSVRRGHFSAVSRDLSLLLCSQPNVRHIVISGLNVHVNVLCDVAEYLCAGLVVADRQRFGVLHDVMLPLSWLLKRTNVAGGMGSVRATNTVWLFARALSALLEPVYSGIGAGARSSSPNYFQINCNPTGQIIYFSKARTWQLLGT